MARKRPRKYGNYTEIIGGRLYASVMLPDGAGTYVRRRKRVANATEARQWAREMLDRAAGSHLEPSGRVTFSELAEWYKREYLLPPVYRDGVKLFGIRTWRDQQTMADRLTLVFGRLPLDVLTLDRLRRYKQERLRSVSITTVNRELALLRTMLRRAVSRRWLRESPFDMGETLIEVSLEPSRVCPLTDRHVRRLLARSRKSGQPLLHHLILVLAFTGARPSEVYPHTDYNGVPVEPLTWSRVLEFDFRAVRLVSFKGRVRSERVVPASSLLERGLRSLYLSVGPEPGDLVFPVKSFKRSWQTLCRACRFDDLRLRDFRAWYNTKLLNMKIDEVSRMLILGHREISTNRRYSSVNDDFIARYRDLIDAGDAVN